MTAAASAESAPTNTSRILAYVQQAGGARYGEIRIAAGLSNGQTSGTLAALVRQRRLVRPTPGFYVPGPRADIPPIPPRKPPKPRPPSVKELLRQYRKDAMTTADTARPDPEDDLDLAALLHDLDIIRRHREMTWQQVAAETGVGGATLSGMLAGKGRPSLASYQRLVRWIDPAAWEYMRPGAAPARIPAPAKVPPRYREPAEDAA